MLEKRTEWLGVRLTAAEQSRIEAAAQIRRQSASGFVRDAARQVADRLLQGPATQEPREA